MTRTPRLPLLAAALLIAALLPAAPAAHAAPAKTPPLTTPWTAQALIGTPLPEYPRPQMTRPDWQNLNGEWELRQSATDDPPQFGVTLPERVNVPFPVESALSGVQRPANDNRNYLFYAAGSRCRRRGRDVGSSSTSAPSTGRRRSGSTEPRWADTPAATTRSPST